ncbi:MAG: universal stress protein [Candidatus Dormibacteraceae bacterium]
MFERLVAAVDDDRSRAARVIQAALELAGGHGGEVLVAHVREVERPGAQLARAGAIPPSLHLESEEDAARLVSDAVQSFHDQGLHAEGAIGAAIGSTAKELLQMAREFNADLILVGDRGSHVTDLLLGGVAHRIVHQADCSVLVVR